MFLFFQTKPNEINKKTNVPQKNYIYKKNNRSNKCVQKAFYIFTINQKSNIKTINTKKKGKISEKKTKKKEKREIREPRT